jgi:hypothetical protein
MTHFNKDCSNIVCQPNLRLTVEGINGYDGDNACGLKVVSWWQKEVDVIPAQAGIQGIAAINIDTGSLHRRAGKPGMTSKYD